MKTAYILIITLLMTCTAFAQTALDEVDYFNRAKQCELREQLDSSLHFYNKALELKGDFMEVYYNRALLLKKMNIPKEAIKDYQEVLKLDPTHPRAYGSMAALKIQLKDFDGALGDLDQQIKISPKDAVALTNRGICLLMMGKRRNACADWRRAEKLGSRQAESMIYKYCD